MLTSISTQRPFPAKNPVDLADVTTCVTCDSESVMRRPLSPPILRVPITAGSLKRCLMCLMKPQPIDGRRCGQ